MSNRSNYHKKRFKWLKNPRAQDGELTPQAFERVLFICGMMRKGFRQVDILEAYNALYDPPFTIGSLQDVMVRFCGHQPKRRQDAAISQKIIPDATVDSILQPIRDRFFSL